MIKLPPKFRKIFGTHGQPAPSEANMPVFITGCMRSGTTFLADKLASHPQLLKIGAELNEVWTQVGGANCSNPCEHKTEEDAEFTYSYNMSSYITDFIRSSRSLKRHFMRLNNKLAGIPCRVSYDWNNIIPLNKSPHLINKTRYVHQLFPSSKILFIVRDIYAHSASMKIYLNWLKIKSGIVHISPENKSECWTSVRLKSAAAKTGSGLYYPGAFKAIPLMWLRLNRMAFEELYQISDDQVIILSYEDMIRQQNNVFKKLFSFLDLDERYRAHENRIAGKLVEHKNTTTKGNPLTKWRSYLSDGEKAIIHETIKEHQESYDFIADELVSKKV